MATIISEIVTETLDESMGSEEAAENVRRLVERNRGQMRLDDLTGQQSGRAAKE
jgi:hypothetical protein